MKIFGSIRFIIFLFLYILFRDWQSKIGVSQIAGPKLKPDLSGLGAGF